VSGAGGPDLWELADDFAVGWRTAARERRRSGPRPCLTHCSIVGMDPSPRQDRAHDADLTVHGVIAATAGHLHSVVNGRAVASGPKVGRPWMWGPCRRTSGGCWWYLYRELPGARNAQAMPYPSLRRLTVCHDTGRLIPSDLSTKSGRWSLTPGSGESRIGAARASGIVVAAVRDGFDLVV